MRPLDPPVPRREVNPEKMFFGPRSNFIRGHNPMQCRLLYLMGQLGPGGSERQLWNLLKAMDRDRYRPAVVVWNYQDGEAYVARMEHLGVPVLPLARCLFAVKKM